MSIDYHLRELEIAKDSSDPRNVLPQLRESDQTILDIGCGIGQTLIALDCLDRTCIGVDVDQAALEYGRENFPEIEFIQADAQAIPLDDQSVDLLFSRVALPYTNIPQVVTEIGRLLKPNGRAWMTFHSLNMAKGFWASALVNRDAKDLLHKTYVVMNGFIFKYTGRLLPFVNKSYESWQDVDAMVRYLQRRGFSVTIGEQNGIALLEASPMAHNQLSTSTEAVTSGTAH